MHLAGRHNSMAIPNVVDRLIPADQADAPCNLVTQTDRSRAKFPLSART